MIGPDAALLTANHDVNDLRVPQFKPIRICKGAWIWGPCHHPARDHRRGRRRRHARRLEPGRGGPGDDVTARVVDDILGTKGQSLGVLDGGSSYPSRG